MRDLTMLEAAAVAGGQTQTANGGTGGAGGTGGNGGTGGTGVYFEVFNSYNSGFSDNQIYFYNNTITGYGGNANGGNANGGNANGGRNRA